MERKRRYGARSLPVLPQPALDCITQAMAQHDGKPCLHRLFRAPLGEPQCHATACTE